jgi:cytoskeletal protein CcmA (bactofilin family)
MLPNFKKSDDASKTLGGMASLSMSSAPAAPTPSVSARPSVGRPGSPSVIGPDLTIAGNLISKGEVQIDGEIQGDIHGTYIIIGEKAKITGGIVAEEVVVRGHVMGSIRGKRVMLQTTSHVEGDVYHQSLAIEQGAFFEGKSRRSEDPLGVAVSSQPFAMPANG